MVLQGIITQIDYFSITHIRIILYNRVPTQNQTNMSKNPPSKSRYRVYYLIDVDGTWHEKDAPFLAKDTKDAESQLRETMKLFPETEYQINYTEPA